MLVGTMFMSTTFIDSVQPRGSEPSKMIYQPLPQLLIIASTSIVYVHLLCLVAFDTSNKRCERFSLSKNDKPDIKLKLGDGWR